MNMGNIYLFVANGTEEVEALSIVDVVRRASIPLKIVSITDSEVITSSHGVRIVADSLFADEKFDDAEMLVLPGGMPGSKNLYEHEGLRKLIKTHAEAGKPLAAICAAPFIYGRMGLLKGRRATCYPGFEQDLKGAEVTGRAVEVDENILTGKGAAAGLPLGYAIVEFFKGKAAADALREGMVFNDLFK